MKTLAWMRWSFLIVGLGLLCGAAWGASRTKAFVDAAATADGTVVALEEHLSRDRDTGRTSRSWAPTVEFQLPSGETRTFTSSMSSSPPAYRVGERVQVLYDREDPGDARLSGTASLWMLPIVLTGFGTIFGSVGAGMFLVRFLARRREEDLRLRGRRVQARFQSVERNGSITVNGRNPYRIVCQWQDPATGLLHVFKSKNLWFDPSEFVRQEELTVFVDPADPRRHAFDLGFLPRLAG